MLKKSILLVGFNNLVTFPATIFVFTWLNNYDVPLSFEEELLPDCKTVVLTIGFCMMCEDFAFHLIHRFMHLRFIYPYFHKLHHTYRTTIGIAAEYSHPVDFIAASVVASGAGSLLLGKNMHFSTFLIWSVVRVCESLDGHCGYDFSWSPYRLIPFSASASYHDFHHSHNVGNYSSFFTFWDTLFGTNSSFYKFYEKINEEKSKL